MGFVKHRYKGKQVQARWGMGFVIHVSRESRYRIGGEWGCNTSYKGKQVQERWKTGFVTQVTRESRYRKGGEWSF